MKNFPLSLRTFLPQNRPSTSIVRTRPPGNRLPILDTLSRSLYDEADKSDQLRSTIKKKCKLREEQIKKNLPDERFSELLMSNNLKLGPKKHISQIDGFGEESLLLIKTKYKKRWDIIHVPNTNSSQPRPWVFYEQYSSYFRTLMKYKYPGVASPVHTRPDTTSLPDDGRFFLDVAFMSQESGISYLTSLEEQQNSILKFQSKFHPLEFLFSAGTHLFALPAQRYWDRVERRDDLYRNHGLTYEKTDDLIDYLNKLLEQRLPYELSLIQSGLRMVAHDLVPDTVLNDPSVDRKRKSILDLTKKLLCLDPSIPSSQNESLRKNKQSNVKVVTTVLELPFLTSHILKMTFEFDKDPDFKDKFFDQEISFWRNHKKFKRESAAQLRSFVNDRWEKVLQKCMEYRNFIVTSGKSAQENDYYQKLLEIREEQKQFRERTLKEYYFFKNLGDLKRYVRKYFQPYLGRYQNNRSKKLKTYVENLLKPYNLKRYLSENDDFVIERETRLLLDAELESACVFSRQCVLITMFDSQPVNRDLKEQLKQAVKFNIGQASYA